MPKRTDINSILIIGAGPIVIGQGCEFDYSGTQGIKALKEEGYRVILINSNPATIMTDPNLADAIYIEPITAEFVEKIIAKERPDAILPTLGGQTALNMALKLDEEGILAKYNVQIIGASINAIKTAEDRGLFKIAMEEIGLSSPKSVIITSLEEAKNSLDFTGLPAIIRPSLTLGGTGGGVANTFEEFIEIVERGLAASPINQIQIDQSLIGWKEYEMEVVRDKNDNAIIICSIENIDAMGVHTGDSVTVAPSLTLTDKEYQAMRDASIAVLRKVGVETGGSNVQFAVNPKNGDMIVIEMNPRVSRSSALASKATGFPIAKVAAKLAIGYTLDELRNDIGCSIPKEFNYIDFKNVLDGKAKNNAIEKYIAKEYADGVSDFALRQRILPASFEPAIDYIVVKIPKFNFEKFGVKNPELGTQMQSVGEVMAIGRFFEEAFMKAISAMEEPWPSLKNINHKDCEEYLARRAPSRFYHIMRAFELGFSTEKIANLTQYDTWFVERFYQIHAKLEEIKSLKTVQNFENLPQDLAKSAKMHGLRDLTIREALNIPPAKKGRHAFKDWRMSNNIRPVFRKIDTCASEFSSSSNYFYSSYEYGNDSESNEAPALIGKKVVIIGSGPNRIGQGIEFDYACVHGAYALKEIGIQSIMINSNPETVSTDYDTVSRLYFEPLTDEHVMAVIENEMEISINCIHNGETINTLLDLYLLADKQNHVLEFTINDKCCNISSKAEFSELLEQFISVIIQFGGQTPLKLRDTLKEYAIPILGMTVDAIDICDDRVKFSQMLEKLALKQPRTVEFLNAENLHEIAKLFEYHCIIRPSSVIGGRGMAIINSKAEFDSYEYISAGIVNEFLESATEFDCDAIRDSLGNIYICGVMQHVEYAGVHSGDSASFIPATNIDAQQKISEATAKIANELDLIGALNIQFALSNNTLYVIEANPRASRSMPFLAKASGIPIIKIATKAMCGLDITTLLPSDKIIKYKEYTIVDTSKLNGVFVKEAVFSFEKFLTSDVILGPEMKSTGEIMGYGKNLAEGYAKAILATNYQFVTSGTTFVSLKDSDKTPSTVAIIKILSDLGFIILATAGTQSFLVKNGIACIKINKVHEGSPNVVEKILLGDINFVINTTSGIKSVKDSLSIRRATIAKRVFYTTTIEAAEFVANVMKNLDPSTFDVYKL